MVAVMEDFLVLFVDLLDPLLPGRGEEVRLADIVEPVADRWECWEPRDDCDPVDMYPESCSLPLLRLRRGDPAPHALRGGATTGLAERDLDMYEGVPVRLP